MKPKEVQPETFCKICDRVPFGKIVPLPGGKWRHDGCELGSEEWRNYYFRLSYDERLPLGELYNIAYGDKEKI